MATSLILSSDYGLDQVAENDPVTLSGTIPARVGPTLGTLTLTYNHGQSGLTMWDALFSLDGGTTWYPTGTTYYASTSAGVFSSAWSTSTTLNFYFENTSLSTQAVTVSFFTVVR